MRNEADNAATQGNRHHIVKVLGHTVPDGVIKVLSVLLALQMTFGTWPEAVTSRLAFAADEDAVETEEVVEAEPVPDTAESPVTYPAQKITALANDRVTRVTVEAGEGVLPEGTKITARVIDDQAVIDAVVAEIEGNGGTAGKIKAFDVTLHDADGNEIEPQGKVTVTFSKTDMPSDDVVVYHVKDTSPEWQDVPEYVAESVETKKAEADSQVFETEHFSIYAVGENDIKRLKVVFHKADGSTTEMYVKEDDEDTLDAVIYDPGVGTQGAGETFFGWSTVEQYTEDTTRNDIAAVRNLVKNKLSSFEDEETLDLYAMMFKSFTVTYVDERNVALGSMTTLVPSYDTTTTAVEHTVNMAYTPRSSTQNFEGWSPTTATAGNITGATYNSEAATAPYANGTKLTIQGDVTLEAVAPNGYWLVFNENGSGGTYNAPQFVKSGEVTQEPTLAMVRNGYTFEGWYTDSDCTDGNEFTFGHALEANTTIYAKWKPITQANYTVIIWKQNVDGTGYDFGEHVTLQGAPGSTINTVTQQGTGTNAYARVNGTNKQYEGFHLKQFDQNVTITPEGNAILNVYYDRNEYTLRFFYARTYTYSNRTYVQVNCNNEGFLQGRANGRNLNNSLTYRGNNDYQLLSGSNTWKDVNNNSVGGNPLNLVSSSYLSKEGVSTGTLQINSVRTDVVRSSTSSSVQSVNMTYYYIDIKVRYEQSLTDLWPVPNEAFVSQTMTSYNRSNNNYTTIRPLLQGSWATGNNIGGMYSTMNLNLFVGNDTTAYFLTYWRYESYYTYQYNVYFSTLEGETAETTYKGDGYVLQSDKSYTVANGQGWGNTSLTDSGKGYWDVGNVTFDGTDIVGRVDTQSSQTINVYYKRKQFTIDYFDGIYVDGNNNPLDNKSDDILHQKENVLYDQDLSSYNEGGSNYYVPEDKEGFVFEGWYLDTEGTHPYEFTKMPQGDIKVYAKWRQVQYRVFLHPNAGTDESLDWGSSSQQMNFRVSYGGKVSAPTGVRDDYDFVGWYSDAACTQVFDADAYVLNDTTVTADYDKTVDMTEPMDKWGNGATTNTDLNRPWITKKLDLYAKWRAKLDGAEGIDIVYDAGEGTNAPTDAHKYLDSAEAIAQAASTAPEGKQFLYWSVQTYDNDTGEYTDSGVTVFPGDNYTVYKKDAKVEDITDGTQTETVFKKYTVKLVAVYGELQGAETTKVVFDPNGGAFEDLSGNYEVDNYYINEVIAIPGDGGKDKKDNDVPAEPTRDGYIFKGWSETDENDVDKVRIEPKATRQKSYAADNLIDSQDLSRFGWAGDDTNILYAVWEPAEVELRLTKELAGTMADLTKKYDFTVTVTVDGTEYRATAQLGDPSGESDNGETVTLTELEATDGSKHTLRVGDQVTITETAANQGGYQTTYQVMANSETNGGAVTFALENTASVTNIAKDEETDKYYSTVVFTNTKDPVVITGIKAVTRTPIGRIGLVAALIATACVAITRTRRERWME